MSTALEDPRPTHSGQSPALCVLVAAAVVVGYLLFERSWSLHALPWLAPHWPDWPESLIRLAVTLVPYTLYAVVLAVWGRSPAARLAGAGCAVATGVVEWGLIEGFTRLVYERGHLTQHAVTVYSWTLALVIPTMVALAWGLARRTGRLWPIGLVTAPVVAAVLQELLWHSAWWQQHVYPGSHVWYAGQLIFLAPAIVAALACWLVEQRQGG